MTGILIILGLLTGSFLNVLIYRIPRGQAFVLGRSRCTHCQHDLGILDLIPLASYLFLRGKCRYCKASISIQYPLVEIASALIWATAGSVIGIIILELFLVLAIIDYQHFVILDSSLIALLIVAIAWHGKSIMSWSYIATALGCGGFFLILWLISRGTWIGFGDVKLAAVLGLLFGFPGAIAVIYIGVILGGLLGVGILLFKKGTMKTKVPFGTILALAGLVYWYFGEPLLLWVDRMLY